jgi:hypothetical protein
MTRSDIIRLAREAGWSGIYSKPLITIAMQEENFLRFAALVAAAEREKIAQWMIERSYATGHGDTVEDLLKELEWQIREREREDCAKLCEEMARRHDDIRRAALEVVAEWIRARGEA